MSQSALVLMLVLSARGFRVRTSGRALGPGLTPALRLDAMAWEKLAAFVLGLVEHAVGAVRTRLEGGGVLGFTGDFHPSRLLRMKLRRL